MASRRDPASARPVPQIYLVTPPFADADAMARDLAAMLAENAVAAVLMRLATGDERSLLNRIKTLAPLVQNAGTALLVDGRPELVARAGADGAHVSGVDAVRDALSALKPERIVGAGGLVSRHDAMLAAEGSADYVMFGEPDASGRRPGFAAVIDRVAWWAEVFEPPCVGYAGSFEEIAPLAQAGADFVAAGDWLWADPAGPAAALAKARACLRVETVA